ncbi:TatD family deoxyribonuclease [Flavobacterium sufflavum]|uniref:TatD family deoxyribonuclease n=1 Tax=Flavobacterium sufflavum TaxID=1921138 RepID=A0A3S2U151_9FLAO|nr:TatD family hydrolase [Flavobacterium sufflavum]RVT74906.1 TatD family deoxyribonuclease [Flavobacterium sufflavum]
MQYFNLHTHQFENQETILELVNQYPWEFDDTIPYYSIGIHPLFINIKRLESDFEILEQKVGLSGCLAIGECGLDKRSETAFEIQLKVLEKQLVLAEKLQKAVVIHCVHAFQELVEMKNRLKLTTPIIIHGFSKKVQLAKQLLDNGFYLSFGRYLLMNPELESVFNSIPENRFFLETDTSDYTIEEVYALAAKYKKITVTELQQIISNNFNTVFNK